MGVALLARPAQAFAGKNGEHDSSVDLSVSSFPHSFGVSSFPQGSNNDLSANGALLFSIEEESSVQDPGFSTSFHHSEQQRVGGVLPFDFPLPPHLARNSFCRAFLFSDGESASHAQRYFGALDLALAEMRQARDEWESASHPVEHSLN
jgi:hypothetical protein